MHLIIKFSQGNMVSLCRHSLKLYDWTLLYLVEPRMDLRDY